MFRKLFGRKRAPKSKGRLTLATAPSTENYVDQIMAEQTGVSVADHRRAMALIQRTYPDIDRHLELTQKLQDTYTAANPKTLPDAIKTCRQMIGISQRAANAFNQWEKDSKEASKLLKRKPSRSRPLPQHLGFRQLAIILEKQGEYKEAIQLCHQAQSQGWSGDWSKRIARCEAKVERARVT